MARFSIRYWCDLSVASGYSVAARGYVSAFETLGINETELRLSPAVSSNQWAASADEDFFPRKYLTWHDFSDEPAVNIVHVHPTRAGRHYCLGWYNVAICAWETDKLPTGRFSVSPNERWTCAESLSRFDEVWVPTKRVADTFIRSGVTSSIFVIPHALLPQLLEREPRTRSPQVGKVHPKIAGDGSDTLRFYYIGSWNDRKNTEGVFRAYLATGWNPSTPVELVMHCVPPSTNPDLIEGHIFTAQNSVSRLKDSLPDPSSCPSFVLDTKLRSYNYILDNIHRRGHVFVTASRGEGFGLPIAEALSLGNQVICGKEVTEPFSVYDEDDQSYVIETDLRSIVPMPEVEGYELNQKWHDPNIDAITDAMKSTLHSAREGNLKRSLGRTELFRARFSPKAIGELIAPRLEVWRDAVSKKGW